MSLQLFLKVGVLDKVPCDSQQGTALELWVTLDSNLNLDSNFSIKFDKRSF